MQKKTISEIYSEWKKMKAMQVKESTLATYMINAEKHILPFFGHSVEIMENDVQMFVSDKLGQGLSVHTVRDIVLVLRMLIAYGARNGWTERREWGVRLPKSCAVRGEAVLTLDEQRVFMGFLRRNFSFRNLGLYICLCTGMRIGEICALRWSDVSIGSRLIRVSRTIERVYVVEDGRRFTKVIIGEPKTACSRRDIPISGELVGMLRSVMRFAGGDSYVLTNSGKPLEPRMYRRYYKLLMSELGLPVVKFHGLRHTFATRCIEGCCDYKTVSAMLGHSDISTTLNLYVHPDITQKRKCIDRMLRMVR